MNDEIKSEKLHNDKKLGLLIYNARLDAGYSQTQFARMLNVKPSYVSMIESGKRTPSGDLMMRILTILDIDLTGEIKKVAPDKLTEEMEIAFDESMKFIKLLGNARSQEEIMQSMIEISHNEKYYAAVQAIMQKESLPKMPEGWLELNKSNKALVERIIKHLINSQKYTESKSEEK